jgi:hypothetical protein
MEMKKLPHTQNAAGACEKSADLLASPTTGSQSTVFLIMYIKNANLKSDVATTVKTKNIEATAASNQN